jgi:hypothetical protein
MTGIFVRVERQGDWESIELEQCTAEEIRQTLQGRPRLELVEWIVGVAGWIRDHVQEGPP